MSDHAHPDSDAFTELARLVRHLGEELAAYRKRAHSAESRLRTLDEQVAQVVGVTPARVLELERENSELRRRVAEARERTEKVLTRVRFLKQQRDSAT